MFFLISLVIECHSEFQNVPTYLSSNFVEYRPDHFRYKENFIRTNNQLSSIESHNNNKLREQSAANYQIVYYDGPFSNCTGVITKVLVLSDGQCLPLILFPRTKGVQLKVAGSSIFFSAFNDSVCSIPSSISFRSPVSGSCVKTVNANGNVAGSAKVSLVRTNPDTPQGNYIYTT